MIYGYTFSIKEETYFFYAMKDDGVYGQQVSPGYFEETKIQSLTPSQKKFFFRIDENNIGFFDKPSLKRYDIRNNQVYTICSDSLIQESVSNSNIQLLHTDTNFIYYKDRSSQQVYIANLSNSQCNRTTQSVTLPYKSKLCSFKTLTDQNKMIAYGNSKSTLISAYQDSDMFIYSPQQYNDSTSLVSDNSVVLCDEQENYVKVYTITSYGIFARKIESQNSHYLNISQMESISSIRESEQNIKAAIIANDNLYIYYSTGLYFIDILTGASTQVTSTPQQQVEAVFYPSKFDGIQLQLGNQGRFNLINSVRADENSQTQVKHTSQFNYGIETKSGKTTTDMTEKGFKVEAKVKAKGMFGMFGAEIGSSLAKSTTEATSNGNNSANQSAQITTFNITTPANTNSFSWQYVGDGKGQYDSLQFPTLFFVDTESNVPPQIDDIKSQFE